MKLFISGQIKDSQNVRNIMQIAVERGHSLTHDWTESDLFLGTPKAKEKSPNETKRRAVDDINGVLAADAYILVTDNKIAGKGMYAELGAAIASHLTTGRPEIYLIGSFNHPSVFYYHPVVKRFSTMDEVLDALGG